MKFQFVITLTAILSASLSLVAVAAPTPDAAAVEGRNCVYAGCR